MLLCGELTCIRWGARVRIKILIPPHLDADGCRITRRYAPRCLRKARVLRDSLSLEPLRPCQSPDGRIRVMRPPKETWYVGYIIEYSG